MAHLKTLLQRLGCRRPDFELGKQLLTLALCDFYQESVGDAQATTVEPRHLRTADEVSVTLLRTPPFLAHTFGSRRSTTCTTVAHASRPCLWLCTPPTGCTSLFSRLPVH